MFEMLVKWKPLHNHIEFEWKFKFLMVAILLVWWPLDRFQHLHHVEFDVKFNFFLNIYEIT
jgi:hypothetical protein